jgi:hypothetical protein
MTTTHPSAPAGASQCDLILAELQRADGGWVSLLKLHTASGSMAVHSRIADLRARSLTIEQRNERIGRMTHSSYRLITKPVQLTLL